ncbi:MAG: hypothetical protein MUF25_13710, partial [Pirellulaceae bacterium]|nr:hypothetical protein [Pirellulaceae bacterium]
AALSRRYPLVSVGLTRSASGFANRLATYFFAFLVAFLAGAFLAGAFLAGAFLAGAAAAAFFGAAFFVATSHPPITKVSASSVSWLPLAKSRRVPLALSMIATLLSTR